MSQYEDGSRKGHNKGHKEDEAAASTAPAAMRLNIAPAPAVAGRIVAPVVPVPTYSPAYAKGGMVRGCGKATKGRGKMRMY